MSEKKKNNSKKFILYLLLALLIGGGIVGYIFYNRYFSSNTKNIDDKTYAYIRTGWDYKQVLEYLKEKDYLINADQFDKVARQQGYPEKIRPGRYKLKAGMSNAQLVKLLMSGKQEPVKLTLQPYWDKHQLAVKVGKNLEVDSLRLETLLGDDVFFKKYGFTAETAMALFLPDTYEFYWNTNAEEFVDKMAKEYKKFWTDERKAKAKAISMSQTEVTILASIIEKEHRMVDELPKIAGLYMNRLKINMPLQADPTIKFALHDYAKARMYYVDLKVESPYNTYLHNGLPPGPICMPSKAAIDAVMNAEKHGYYYMTASITRVGYHEFTVTLDEHNSNANKYHKKLDDKGIR